MFDDGQERNQQITEENFSVSGTFSIKTSWVLAARQIRPEGMIIGHPTRGLIKGDGALPSADSVFVTLGNPQGRWVIKGRG